MIEEVFLKPLAISFDFIFFLIPIGVPILLGFLIFNSYVAYNRKKYYNSLEWVLLEVVPPQDQLKSPAAMELFLLALQQSGGESTWIDRWVKGKVRTWFSLELVSLGGRVKFFIYCESKFKKFIESQLYAQFPGSEVRLADDYAIKFNEEEYSMMATELKLTKPDPYPIKTYLDYQLDQNIEEEFKIDPMTPVIEFFSSIPEGNYACIQIIVRVHKAEDPDPTKLFPSFYKKIDNWKEVAKKEAEEIKKKSFIEFEEGEVKRKQNIQTETQKRMIAALDRSVTKFAFDTGIRLLYIGKKDVFAGANFGLLNGTFRQYSSNELNGFAPAVVTGFDYPWQDPFGAKVKKMKSEILEAYQLRDYFWRNNYKGNPRKFFVLNTEELATIYHFPGKVSQAPSLDRVDSRKVSAPDNLPI
jgi:hypothetical protein